MRLELARASSSKVIVAETADRQFRFAKYGEIDEVHAKPMSTTSSPP